MQIKSSAGLREFSCQFQLQFGPWSINLESCPLARVTGDPPGGRNSISNTNPGGFWRCKKQIRDFGRILESSQADMVILKLILAYLDMKRCRVSYCGRYCIRKFTNLYFYAYSHMYLYIRRRCVSVSSAHIA